MPIAAQDILRVAARMTIQGRGDVVNVYHLRVFPLAVGDGDTEIIAGVLAWIETLYTAARLEMVNEQTFEDISIYNVTQGYPVGVFPWPTLVAGAKTSEDALPSQLAALVRFTTGYSRNWARKFLGTFTEAAVDTSGHVATTALTNLANYAGAVLTEYITANTSYLTAVVFNKAIADYVVLTEAVIHNVWSTIRTRREGRGS